MATKIYHITHIKNLEGILQTASILCKHRLEQEKHDFKDISHKQIQDRRSKTQVPCGKGMLHDYVPFYFAPRSPMLYSISRGYVEGTREQTCILHLVTTVEVVEADHIPFVFTDGHATMDYSDFYDDLDDLEQVIDWDLMKDKYWSDTDDDPNRKCRRQAEFLVYDFLPWSLITEVGVINNSTKSDVQKILNKFNETTPVHIRTNWYYS